MNTITAYLPQQQQQPPQISLHLQGLKRTSSSSKNNDEAFEYDLNSSRGNKKTPRSESFSNLYLRGVAKPRTSSNTITGHLHYHHPARARCVSIPSTPIIYPNFDLSPSISPSTPTPFNEDDVFSMEGGNSPPKRSHSSASTLIRKKQPHQQQRPKSVSTNHNPKQRVVKQPLNLKPSTIQIQFFQDNLSNNTQPHSQLNNSSANNRSSSSIIGLENQPITSSVSLDQHYHCNTSIVTLHDHLPDTNPIPSNSSRPGSGASSKTANSLNSSRRASSADYRRSRDISRISTDVEDISKPSSWKPGGTRYTPIEKVCPIKQTVLTKRKSLSQLSPALKTQLEQIKSVPLFVSDDIDTKKSVKESVSPLFLDRIIESLFAKEDKLIEKARIYKEFKEGEDKMSRASSTISNSSPRSSSLSYRQSMYTSMTHKDMPSFTGVKQSQLAEENPFFIPFSHYQDHDTNNAVTPKKKPLTASKANRRSGSTSVLKKK
ncbi:hypothetical protein FDP41_001401 [Naegleria fowleri]|uniref:Uncharacterized protein n=1 Tax=Naegleria fowleri TaxID=5763 RepID=A0A6A5BNY7_NAEFO|nr:uncharacterized protein FDP41_001401 [Naegleria fowleri]KAF0979733.1 hypothetical protein FDP41_001401 [Naegleria fowleri]CAG4709639.1 unnamed protein product [Naegleria fowleri]